MNYKKLGNTDLNVSTICLGTMTWGEQNTQNEAFEQMDYSLDNGVNFWDTAELYAVPPKAETYGHTETIIGNWFEGRLLTGKWIMANGSVYEGEFYNNKPNGKGTWKLANGNTVSGQYMQETLEKTTKPEMFFPWDPMGPSRDPMGTP